MNRIVVGIIGSLGAIESLYLSGVDRPALSFLRVDPVFLGHGRR